VCVCCVCSLPASYPLGAGRPALTFVPVSSPALTTGELSTLSTLTTARIEQWFAQRSAKPDTEAEAEADGATSLLFEVWSFVNSQLQAVMGQRSALLRHARAAGGAASDGLRPVIPYVQYPNPEWEKAPVRQTPHMQLNGSLCFLFAAVAVWGLDLALHACVCVCVGVCVACALQT
jgi:hypothetical protein